ASPSASPRADRAAARPSPSPPPCRVCEAATRADPVQTPTSIGRVGESRSPHDERGGDQHRAHQPEDGPTPALPATTPAAGGAARLTDPVDGQPYRKGDRACVLRRKADGHRHRERLPQPEAEPSGGEKEREHDDVVV